MIYELWYFAVLGKLSEFVEIIIVKTIMHDYIGIEICCFIMDVYVT